MRPEISVLVTPRDGHHYQDLLYGHITPLGVRVRYASGPTRSQTLNVAAAPFVLLWRRVQHFRVLHIHWTFQFSLPWARRRKWAQMLMQWWFGFYLWCAQSLGYRIVWTAHDLLPHDPIFRDDRRARDMLIARATTVLALSEATARELTGLGARNVRVTPMGTYSDPYPVSLSRVEARRTFGFGDDDVVFGLIGRIEPYKGVDLLLVASAQLPVSSPFKVLVAGLCTDDEYREELSRLSAALGDRVVLDFQWVPNEDLARYFQAIDFAVLPFREITNSASVLLAQSFGRPVAISDLEELRDIPESGAIRFDVDGDGEIEPLVTALKEALELTEEEYSRMSKAALAWATQFDWASVAKSTVVAYEEALRSRLD